MNKNGRPWRKIVKHIGPIIVGCGNFAILECGHEQFVYGVKKALCSKCRDKVESV